MRRVRRVGVVLASIVWAHAAVLAAQDRDRAVTRANVANLIGTWRYKEATDITWDSSRKVVSAVFADLLLTFEADGTFDLSSTTTYTSGWFTGQKYVMALGSIPEGKGRWSFAGDTLVIVYNDTATRKISGIRNKYKPDQMLMGGEPPDAVGEPVWVQATPRVLEERFTLSSPAPGKLLTMTWMDPTWFPLDLWRIDPTKPIKPLVLAPPLKPSALAGTWVAKTSKGVDTLILRANGTWMGKEISIWPPGKGGCMDVEAVPTKASNTGKFYLGPGYTIVFIDDLGRRVCSTERGGWRHYMFKLNGRHLRSYNPLFYYERMGPAKP